MTAFAFGIGVTAAAVTAWVLSGHSIAKASVFLLAMLFGGSMYFLLNARE
jgi:plasmid maintenance system antidote protein VapI